MELKDKITLSISSLALLVAALSYWNTFRQRRVDNQRTVRASLTDVIAELVQVDWDRVQLDRDNDGSKDDRIVEMRRILNTKRAYLARHGDFLAQQMTDLITDTDFNILARAFAEVGDHDKAKDFWGRCVAKSPTPLIRAWHLRGFARFCFRFGDFEVGRKTFRESLEVSLPDNDEVRRTKADTYAMWMKAERDFGFPEECQQLHKNAVAAAKRIGTAKAREDMISYVDSLFQAVTPKSGS